MKPSTIFGQSVLVLFLALAGCQKEYSNSVQSVQTRNLNAAEQETVVKFQKAAAVLQDVFSTQPALRAEFNQYIAAKLTATSTEEEISFYELFNAKPVNYPTVATDFLVRFKEVFVAACLRNPAFSGIKNADALAAYFDLTKSNTEAYTVADDALCYEIYYPYSENWKPTENHDFTITHHPLTNKVSNVGKRFNTQGKFVQSVVVNDGYAQQSPTYIITHDDGFASIDHDQVWSSEATTPLQDPPVSPCTTQLMVKDGYFATTDYADGLFEGKVEYAVAISTDLNKVEFLEQGAQTLPILYFNTKGGFKQLRKKQIRRMQANEKEFVSLNFPISKWCLGDPEKAVVLYEYDRPTKLDRKNIIMSAPVGSPFSFVTDPALRNKIISIGSIDGVKVIVPGAPSSTVFSYFEIGSYEVYVNQTKPLSVYTPSLVNGRRPYGIDRVIFTLEMK